MKISYSELEKLNARFDLSAAESATAISRAGRPFLPFSVQAVDDRRLNRTPPRNSGYSGSDADLQLRPAPGDINQEYQKRGGQKGFAGADDDSMSSADHVDAALSAVDFEDPDSLDAAAAHLTLAARKKRGERAGSQHLRM